MAYKSKEDIIVSDALTVFLEQNADGKWERHFGTWDSIVWNKGATGKQKESEYLSQKNTLEINQKARIERIYPSIGDQLDDIYHNGIDGWKATIKAIKDKYPKE